MDNHRYVRVYEIYCRHLRKRAGEREREEKSGKRERKRAESERINEEWNEKKTKMIIGKYGKQ